MNKKKNRILTVRDIHETFHFLMMFIVFGLMSWGLCFTMNWPEYPNFFEGIGVIVLFFVYLFVAACDLVLLGLFSCHLFKVENTYHFTEDKDYIVKTETKKKTKKKKKS